MIEMLADTITADMGLIPGFAICGPAMGLPLSILAAFIERPFVTRSGVQRHAIWYSIQANLLSLLMGYAGLFVAAGIGDAVFRNANSEAILFVIWPISAIFISIVVEQFYLVYRSQAKHVRVRWTALGNIVSSLACIGLLVLVLGLRAKYPSLKSDLLPYQGALWYSALVASVAVYVAAFLATRRARVLAPECAGSTPPV